MSNGNVLERLYKLQATIGKLVIDGRRNPHTLIRLMQEFVNNPHPGMCDYGRSESVGVPKDFDISNFFSKFRERYKNNIKLDPQITDRDFGELTEAMKPKDCFIARLLEIQDCKVTTEEVFHTLLNGEGTPVFLGAHGLALWHVSRNTDFGAPRRVYSFTSNKEILILIERMSSFFYRMTYMNVREWRHQPQDKFISFARV